MTTLEKLRAAFQRAIAHRDELEMQYKKTVANFYGKNSRGEVVDLKRHCFSDDGTLWNYATEDFNEVGTLGRTGRFYQRNNLWYKLRSMEHDLDNAYEHGQAFLTVLAEAGIDLDND